MLCHDDNILCTCISCLIWKRAIKAFNVFVILALFTNIDIFKQSPSGQLALQQVPVPQRPHKAPSRLYPPFVATRSWIPVVQLCALDWPYSFHPFCKLLFFHPHTTFPLHSFTKEVEGHRYCSLWKVSQLHNLSAIKFACLGCCVLVESNHPNSKQK